MNHTPGPWIIFKGYIVQATEDGSVPLNTKWIAELKYFGPDHTEGNAHLMVAAPELEAALIKILEDPHCNWITNGGLEMAAVALAKATSYKDPSTDQESR